MCTGELFLAEGQKAWHRSTLKQANSTDNKTYFGNWIQKVVPLPSSDHLTNILPLW